MIEISQYLFYKLINILTRKYHVNQIYFNQEIKFPIIPNKKNHNIIYD
jgi:hypothetical protein